MPVARLGNVGVREVIGADPDGTPIHRRYTGQHTTVMQLPPDEEGWTHDERVRQAVHADGHWAKHSSRPPAWLECDDPDLQTALAEHWGCPVGEPTGWINHVEAVVA
jgi:hypothetical protein